MAEAEAQDPRLLGLSSLLQLEKEARHAPDLPRLQFLLVNETYRLFRYHQAVLWRLEDQRNLRLQAVSGLAVIERDAPYVRWLEPLLTQLLPNIDPTRPQALDRSHISHEFHQGWDEWSPGHGLICPLQAPDGSLLGGLWLTRDTPWNESEIALLSLLGDAYAHAWAALLPRHTSLLARTGSLIRRRRGRLLLLLLFATSGFLPLRYSALAPAEVAPIDPLVVASPYDGVIASFHVAPNQAVNEGELLFVLEDTQLRNRLEIARKELAVATAEYLAASRKAFQDARTKGEVALLEARREQRRAEVEYTAELLERIQVKAPRNGVAVFNDVNDWLGRPVAVGEKVLTLADPQRTELEIHLPVADAISLAPGAEVLMFLDTQPTQPLKAELTRTAYEARPTPAGVLAFHLKARFINPDPAPRIGIQGTAKLYGPQTTLFHYVMRRPIAAARQWTGL